MALLSAALPGAQAGETPSGPWSAEVSLRSLPLLPRAEAEALFPADKIGEWFLGGYAAYALYWMEAGVELLWRDPDGLLSTDVAAGIESGEMVPIEQRATEEREPGMRALVRSGVGLDLRFSRFRLYNRADVLARVRTFVEYDPFRDAELGSEFSVFDTIRPSVRLLSIDRSELSFYVSGAIEAEASAGLTDLRPSTGLLFETLPEGLVGQADFFYGLRDGRLRGFGAILSVGFRSDG